MAEDTVMSRYVKLTKDHDAPMEEIRPGELNQPVRVPQLEVRRCGECGQPLPESYEPPADEPWTTGICGCSEDTESCWTGGIAVAAATALIHGIDLRSSFLVVEGLFFAWWMCGIYTGIFRQQLQKKYHLKNSPCDPCMVHCCMHWCAVCQEHREMKSRLADNIAMPMTVVNPPAVQEMSMNENHGSAVPETSAQQNEHGSLEMHPL